MFQYVYDNNETQALLCSSGSVDIPDCFENRTLGFVSWSTSPFLLSTLLEPISDTTTDTVFPYYSIQELERYDDSDSSTDVSRWCLLAGLHTRTHTHTHTHMHRLLQ